MTFWLYVVTAVISFFLFRDMIKKNVDAFNGVDFKDIVSICSLILFPVLNLIVSFSLHQVLTKKNSNESFHDILKKIFFI